MSGTDLLPRTADIELWSTEEKAVADLIGFTAEVRDRDSGQKTKVVAPLGVRLTYIEYIRRTELDPLARQVYLILFDGRWTIHAAIDGLRVVAEKSKGYRGQTEAQWSDGKLYERPVILDGKLVLNPDGTVYTEPRLVWHEGWAFDGVPALARVGVWKKGARAPIWGVATWEAYGKTTGQWKKNGAHMLAKVAEALALRKAFPMVLSGLYTEDEFDRGDTPEDSVGPDYIELIKAADTVEEVTRLYEEAKVTHWSRKLDGEARARLSALRAKAEEKPTVVVTEGA